MSQEAYARGVAIAEQRFGAETRDFDRAIWGMTEVIRAGGRDVEPMDVANRWHYPLASADKNHLFERWQSWFASVVADSVKAELPFECRGLMDGRDTRNWWRFRNAQNAVDALNSSAVIDKKAADLIDSEIKRKFPKVRRNTKKWNELADSVREKAKGFVREDLRRSAETQLAQLDEWMNSAEERRERDSITQTADGKAARAADMLAIDPDNVAAKELAQLAERIREKLAERVASMERNRPTLETLAV